MHTEGAPIENSVDPRPAPRCRACGYDLTGMRVEECCPECGQRIWETPTHPHVTGRAVWALVLAIASTPGALLVLPGVVLGVLSIVWCVIVDQSIRRGDADRVNYSLTYPAQILGGLGLLASFIMVMIFVNLRTF